MWTDQRVFKSQIFAASQSVKTCSASATANVLHAHKISSTVPHSILVDRNKFERGIHFLSLSRVKYHTSRDPLKEQLPFTSFRAPQSSTSQRCLLEHIRVNITHLYHFNSLCKSVCNVSFCVPNQTRLTSHIRTINRTCVTVCV